MLSLEDYSSLAETSYLLQSPANAERLRAALSAAAKGETTLRGLRGIGVLLTWTPQGLGGLPLLARYGQKNPQTYQRASP